MLEAVSWYVIALITHFLDCYAFSKFTNQKYHINFNYLLALSIVSFGEMLVRINFISVLQSIFSNLLTFLILKLVFNKSISKTLVGTLFIFLGYAIAEMIFSFIFIIGLNIDTEYFVNNNVGNLIVNSFVFLFFVFIVKIKKITSLVTRIIDWCESNKIANLIFNISLVMIFTYIVLELVTIVDQVKSFVIIFFVLLLNIIIFVGGFFSEKSSNNQLTIKYDNLLDYVRDYEKEVVEKGKAIHEHKNQLAVISGMIPPNDKKVLDLKKYVDKNLEKVKKLDDNVWLERLVNLPTGGIKGLVYLKIKKMLENNISIYIEVDSNLKNKKKWNNINKNLEDYTRILGVYLDNAIEAAIDAKDKQIIIEFIDNEDNIEFVLSNTYKDIIDFNEIDKEKYSTKGKNRGYGLSLVKDIVENNDIINQSREINGKFFVQKLTIKK